MATSAAKTQKKRCNPFILEVLICMPEDGFKFEVAVQCDCSLTNDPIWKLVFDLSKLIDNKFVQIVHVSFTSKTSHEQIGVQNTAANGVNLKQVDLANAVFKMTKDLSEQPTSGQKEAIHSAMSKVAVAGK